MHQHRFFTAPILALGLLLATPGFAADPPKKAGSFGAGKGSSGAYLTRDELRDCLAQQAQLAQLDAQLPKDKAELVAAQDELERSGATLKATFDALDRTNADGVAAYNEQARTRDERIDAHQARAAAYNERVAAAAAQRSGFATACGNRKYFEEDAIAIRRGK